MVGRPRRPAAGGGGDHRRRAERGRLPARRTATSSCTRSGAPTRATPGSTLGTLMDYLPQSNDPGCPRRVRARARHRRGAGHRPEPAARGGAACAATRARATSATAASTASATRSCGSTTTSSSRRSSSAPRSARGAAPDCAQGAYHDYWFAVVGADDATLRRRSRSPTRAGCAASSRRRSCARAGTARSWRTAPRASRSRRRRTSRTLCDGLDGLQREGCVTAASVIGPPDPARAARDLRAAAATRRDAANCVRGTKVQNLLGRPDARRTCG